MLTFSFLTLLLNYCIHFVFNIVLYCILSPKEHQYSFTHDPSYFSLIHNILTYYYMLKHIFKIYLINNSMPFTTASEQTYNLEFTILTKKFWMHANNLWHIILVCFVYNTNYQKLKISYYIMLYKTSVTVTCYKKTFNENSQAKKLQCVLQVFFKTSYVFIKIQLLPTWYSYLKTLLFFTFRFVGKISYYL